MEQFNNQPECALSLKEQAQSKVIAKTQEDLLDLKEEYKYSKQVTETCLATNSAPAKFIRSKESFLLSSSGKEDSESFSQIEGSDKNGDGTLSLNEIESYKIVDGAVQASRISHAELDAVNSEFSSLSNVARKN